MYILVQFLSVTIIQEISYLCWLEFYNKYLFSNVGVAFNIEAKTEVWYLLNHQSVQKLKVRNCLTYLNMYTCIS